MNHYSEQDLRNTLGAELSISDPVNQRLNQVYADIRSGKLNQERHQKTWTGRAAVAAAAIFACGIFCVSNPAFAEKLPLIGQLFAELGDISSFPGDYSDIGTDVSTASQTSDGVTVTLSEVYCNTAALYFTLELEAEEAFDNYFADENDAPILALEGSLSYSFSTEPVYLHEYLDGKLVDDHTYIGLLRVDLQEALTDYSAFEEAVEAANLAYDSEAYELYGNLISEISLPENFDLTLEIDQIIGDLEETVSIYEAAGTEEPTDEELSAMIDEEWETWMNELYDSVPDYTAYPNQYQNYWYDGPFSFDINVSVDTEQTITVVVDEDTDESYYIESVTKTPFELTVNEVDNLYSADQILVVLDADGRKLPNGENGGSASTFQTDGYNLTSIDLYSISWNDWESLHIKGSYFEENETDKNGKTLKEVLDENCLYHRTVDLS